MIMQQKIFKIAKQVYAKFFGIHKQNGFIYLFNDLDPFHLQYIIKANNDKYIVEKVFSPKQISNTYDIEYNDAIDLLNDDYALLFDSNIIKNKYIFDLQQMYDFFVFNEHMRVRDFNDFFDCNINNSFQKIIIGNITIQIETNSFNQRQKNDIINLIKYYVKLYSKIFSKKVYICCRKDIKNHDNTQTLGNTMHNLNNFDICIQIANYDSLYVLSHEIGHSYQDEYCDKNYIDQIFELNKKDRLFYHPQNLYNRRQEFIPQLFAEYHVGKMDNKTKENFEKLILEKSK